jgi:hypothetical protein
MCHPRCLVKILNVGIVILLATAFLAACNTPFSLFGGEGGDALSDDASDSGSGTDEDDVIDEAIWPVPPAVCPSTAKIGTLEFKHHLGWGMAGIGKFSIDVEGSYAVNFIESIATHEPEDKVGIHNLPKEPVEVTISVVEFRDCANATATTYMDIEVRGTCVDGVLTLYIDEFYREDSVTIMCGEDRDKPLPIQIPIAAMEKPVVWTIQLSDLWLAPQEVPVPFMGAGLEGERTFKFSYFVDQ